MRFKFCLQLPVIFNIITGYVTEVEYVKGVSNSDGFHSLKTLMKLWRVEKLKRWRTSRRRRWWWSLLPSLIASRRKRFPPPRAVISYQPDRTPAYWIATNEGPLYDSGPDEWEDAQGRHSSRVLSPRARRPHFPSNRRLSLHQNDLSLGHRRQKKILFGLLYRFLFWLKCIKMPEKLQGHLRKCFDYSSAAAV
jgi:hypothetical protein